jgi:hypothetical protein
MYRQEAMWIHFRRDFDANPYAAMIGAGAINAVTGEIMKHKGKDVEMILKEKQNYIVTPPQPWLDGWKDKDGKIYQFVAAEMGSGETVEGQLTGKEEVGGIQFAVFRPVKQLIKHTTPREYVTGGSWDGYPDVDYVDEMLMECSEPMTLGAGVMAKACAFRARDIAPVKSIQAMGLGRGGEIQQKIYPDPYGLEAWKKSPAEKLALYMVSPESFKQITGHPAPPTPVTYEKYQQFGLPWFELWDKNLKDTPGASVFSTLKTVTGKKGKKIKVG